MKKIVALLLAVLMCVGLLAACGESGATTDNGDSGNTADNGNTAVTGETFDAGNVSCIVPSGWKALPVKDLFSDDDAYDPDKINIGKGIESDLDLFSKPYISIVYYGPDSIMWEPTKELYDDVVDLDDMTIGSYTWKGFSCDSIGYKYYMLWTGEDDGDQFQVSVLYESTGGSVKLEDADVQAIIASIKPSK